MIVLIFSEEDRFTVLWHEWDRYARTRKFKTKDDARVFAEQTACRLEAEWLIDVDQVLLQSQAVERLQ